MRAIIVFIIVALCFSCVHHGEYAKDYSDVSVEVSGVAEFEGYCSSAGDMQYIITTPILIEIPDYPKDLLDLDFRVYSGALLISIYVDSRLKQTIHVLAGSRYAESIIIPISYYLKSY